MLLAWGAKVSPEFCDRTIAIAVRIGADPSALMACMAFETGRSFSASKRNPITNATGLIGFMPYTAVYLGTTIDALAAMTAEEQLGFVERYFEPYADRVGALADLYMAILWPSAIGAADDAVIFKPGSKEYLANRGLDIDHDGGVTKHEAASFVARMLEEGLLPVNAARMDASTPTTSSEHIVNPEQQSPFEIPVPKVPETVSPSEGGNMGPLALAIPLLQSLFQIFQPLAQAKLAGVLNKQTGDPAIAQQMAAQVLAALQQTAVQAGVALPPPAPPSASEAQQSVAATEQIAAIKAAAVARAEVKAALEQQAHEELDRLDKLSPILDKLADARRADVAIDTASADAASARQDATRVRSRLLRAVWLAYGAGAALIGAISLAQIVWGTKHEVDPQIIGAMLLAFGAFPGLIATMMHYAFGTTGSSGAKDVVISELAAKR